MSRFWTNFQRFLLILGDLAIMFMALWLALLIRHGSAYSLATWEAHWQIFGVLFLLWLPIYFAFNLYDLKVNLYVIPLLTNLLRATAINTIIAVIYFYLISTDVFITPKTILALTILLLTIMLFAWRRPFYSLIKNQIAENNLIFIGWDPIVNEVLQQCQNYGYRAQAVFRATSEPIINSGLTVYNNFDHLAQVIKEKKINYVVLNNSVSDAVTNELFNKLNLRLNFISLSKFYEQIFQKIPLTIINQSWFLENLSEGNKGPFEVYKRILDIGIALIISLVSLPFIPLIVMLIAVDSKGAIFFKQIRTGHDGKNFTAVKFRSMYQNAEQNGPEWAKKNDPRVTRIGRFFRKTRIDEIPQLWNILRGEMSFVGPRPERPEFIEKLSAEIPFYKERLLVKPGLTGWAQILGPAYGGSREESLIKLQYDLYYIKNRNFFLDLGIILKTLNTVLKGSGQ